MNHLIAIETLQDAAEEAEKQCKHLSRGIAKMMKQNLTYPEAIREDALTRWRHALEGQQETAESLRRSIKFLEDSMRTAPVTYGIKRKGASEIFEIEGLSYTEARDLCEAGGAQLYKRNYKGHWEEA